ncbi:hypothetical protein Y032_0007g3188 [Ancylostoma ceylanicum]|uniref:Leucine Rich repeat-containing domain protein n=1 Tax=Ancylostoma ceylanicum TaxID=53326 RepID=A0A016VNM3_9BILA|nr:hypothetical protein Y032_0007g3188 [Ancylostoma ceylanicum]
MSVSVEGVEERIEGENCADKEENVIEVDRDAISLDLTRTRLMRIEGFEFLHKIESLCLRWNLLKKIEGLDTLTTLTYLDLYDNQIEKIENLSTLVNLETLDLSFNRIIKIENLEKLTNLKTLYLVHNKISKIEGLEKVRFRRIAHVTLDIVRDDHYSCIYSTSESDPLVNLEYLELGDNRIKKIENLDTNCNIVRLFLGANQIRKIENLDNLKKIEVLSLPANAITVVESDKRAEADMLQWLRESAIQLKHIRRYVNPFVLLQGVSSLSTLREIYLAQNGVQSTSGLENLSNLEILDFNYNRLNKVQGIRHLKKLTDFWAKNNKLEDWQVFDELVELPYLNLVYLENNPFSEVQDYRAKAIRLLPQITRLDSTQCRDPSLLKAPVLV